MSKARLEAFSEAAVMTEGGLRKGLSNVTDMAQAPLSSQRHAAECHPIENLGAR
jgi:hypothetical protein